MAIVAARTNSKSSQGGFTLLEVLVASLVTTVGLLGVFQLHTQAKRNSFESFNYASASALTADVIDRIRLNPTQLNNYLGTNYGEGEQPLPGTSCALNAGAITNCTEAQMTAWDRYQWEQLLMGSTKVRNGKAIGSANGLIGCIYATGDLVRVVVAWRGLDATAVNDGGSEHCGDAGVYQRKVEMTTMITSSL